MKLGQRLIKLGVIAPDEVERALAAQMVYGGRIGTNLVELNHLEFDALATALGMHHEREPATADHFARADEVMQQRVPAEVAARLHAVPLHRISASEVLVAVSDPLPIHALDELSTHLQGFAVEAIAPELRLLYHLERVYGVQRTNRFRRVHRDDAPRDDRRNYVRTLSDVEEPPDPPSHLARIAVKRIRLSLSGELDLADETSSIEGALRSLRRATGRDRLGDIVVDVLSKEFDGAFSAGMVLSVRREVLFGWRGFVRENDQHQIEAVAMPLALPSLLREPVLRRRAFAGPPPGGGTPLDHKLWLLLRTGPPVEVAVVPLELSGSIVGALYTQSEEAISAEMLTGLCEIATALVAAFDRLLRAGTR